MKRILGLVLCFVVFASVAYAAPKKAVKKVEKVKEEIVLPPQAVVPPPAVPQFVKKLAVSGSLRVRYSSYQAAATPDTLGISRARIKITGDVTPDISFLIQPDFGMLSTTGTVAFADVYGEYKCPATATVVKFGQFLLPFAYDSAKYKTIYGTGLNPSHYGVIMPARDYGIRVLGSIPYLSGIYYDGALVNGSSSTTDNNKSKDIVGRASYKNDFIDVGVSGYYGKAGAAETTKKDGALDIEYKLAPCQIVAEYLLGTNIAATARIQEASLQLSGIFDAYEPLVKYESYDPDTATAGNIVNTLTLGCGYLFDKTTKLIVNYNLVGEETTQVGNNILLLEFQAQI